VEAARGRKYKSSVGRKNTRDRALKSKSKEPKSRNRKNEKGQDLTSNTRKHLETSFWHPYISKTLNGTKTGTTESFFFDTISYPTGGHTTSAQKTSRPTSQEPVLFAVFSQSKNPTSPPSKEPTTIISPSENPTSSPSEELATLVPTISPTNTPLIVFFSPFSLQIMMTSSRSFLEDGILFKWTRLYLESFYKEATDGSILFRRLSFLPICTNDVGTSNDVSSKFKCTFEGGAALIDSRAAVPRREMLDWLNVSAFDGAKIFDYLAFLHASEDPGLEMIYDAVFTAASDVEKNKGSVEVSTVSKNISVGGNSTYGFVGGAMVGFVFFFAFNLLIYIKRCQGGKEFESEDVADAFENRYRDDISELSMSITSVL